jgi:hypothetical protein
MPALGEAPALYATSTPFSIIFVSFFAVYLSNGESSKKSEYGIKGSENRSVLIKFTSSPSVQAAAVDSVLKLSDKDGCNMANTPAVRNLNIMVIR